MQCKCGGSSEYEHKVVRNKQVVGTYQKCPGCGRTLITSGEAALSKLYDSEENDHGKEEELI